jgi:YidC/Oxa1 family membrane protein insertase
MPNIRAFLWIALVAILYLNYDAWQHDYDTAVPAPATVGDRGSVGRSLGDTVPSVPSDRTAGAAPSPGAAPATGAVGNAALSGSPTALAPATDSDGAAQMIHVKTDVLDLEINLRGGELDQAELLKYPIHKDQPGVPVQLLNRDPATLYVLQTGLTDEGDPTPDHRALWSATQSSYELQGDAAQLRVPLTWTDGRGLTVTKTFVFKRGWYAFDLTYDVYNATANPRNFAAYSQILRHWERASRSYFDVETYSFKGPAVWDGAKSHDLKVEDTADKKYSDTVTNGWIASLQHHFVAAIVPPANQPYLYKLNVDNSQYLLSATGPTFTVPAGGQSRFTEKLFVGPKLQSQLAATGPSLERAADYGRLTVIAEPLFSVLNFVHGLTGNWGWSIIIVTALIKLIFYPLSQASGRSMAKMRAVGPRMKQIQDTFKDDREKLGRAMMDLYKKEKINPLAGCLPMVVQIPVFISFYWVLLESVEMRQAPFMLWVNDLSYRDPYFVLPLLMGGAMFAQFKTNPPPPDPMQAKIMQFMPLVMTAMMAWFPAGLVLYWLTNTVLSIAQQWRVNQVVQAEAHKKRT